MCVCVCVCVCVCACMHGTCACVCVCACPRMCVHPNLKCSQRSIQYQLYNMLNNCSLYVLCGNLMTKVCFPTAKIVLPYHNSWALLAGDTLLGFSFWGQLISSSNLGQVQRRLVHGMLDHQHHMQRTQFADPVQWVDSGCGDIYCGLWQLKKHDQPPLG